MTKIDANKNQGFGFKYMLYPFKTLGLVFSNRKLLLLFFASIGLNILVFIGLFILLNLLSKDIIESIKPGLATVLLEIVRIFLIFVALVVLFVVIAMPLNAPIYSLMFTEVFRILKIKENPLLQVKNTKSALRRVGISLGFEIKKLIVMSFFFVVNIIFSFLLNLIPFVGQVLAIILQVLFMAFFGAIDIFEPVQTNQLYRFRDRMRFLIRKPRLFWFSALGGLFISFPLVNILMLPIFVITGIIVWSEEESTD